MNELELAKQNIAAAIIANGNNEITADVLRPLLEAICDAALSITGDNGDLTTTNKDDLVSAINELKTITDNLTGVVILTGNSDPNVTSPANASLGNYYARYSGSTLISFWIFNGYEWVEIKEDTGGDTFADYTDTTAMIADQTNQSDQVVYAVFDASDDSNITFAPTETKLQAFYRYNGVATGSIDDYTLVSAPYAGGGGLQLGETDTTSYRGDRGKIAYDHTFETNNPHNVTKAQVGLPKVENTADLDKPISTLTQYALNDKVNSKTSSEPLGSDKVFNIVSLTQAEYDAGTPNSDTFYIITDA